MGLEGTLADFSVTDILQVLGLQKKTGTLTVEGTDDTIVVSLLGGEVVSADAASHGLEESVGTLLVRSGRLTPEDLARAHETQKESQQGLVHVLVRQNLVSSEVMREALRLQIGRVIFAAFRWTNGRFRFLQEGVIDHLAPLLSPIPAEAFLMDAVQFLDEWPKLEKKIPFRDLVYRRVTGLEDLRLVLSAEENGEGALVVSPPEAEAWKWVDGNRPVGEILERAFLSDIDTYRGLADLQDRNLIAQARLRAVTETQRFQRGPWISARAVGLWAVFLLIAALAVREAPRNPWNITLHPLGQRRETADLLKAVSLGRLAAIERALRVYYDSSGQYPKRVEDLLASGVLTREAITDPYGRSYRYILRSEVGKYSLYGRNAQGNIDLDLSFERSLAPVSQSRPVRNFKLPEQNQDVQIVR
jgi:hypothetical protein